MTSSDERREVAARLRDDNHGYGTEYDFFLHALGISREGRGPCDWAKVHHRLADLIDPTCKVSSVETYDDELGRLEGWEFHLTCGHSFQRPWNEQPAYCPECGARVVDEDD